MAGMTTHRYGRRHATSGTEPRTYPWPLLLIAAPAAVAIWSGWVGLGGMCGFGLVYPLPGIIPWLQVNTAITLPVGVEAYGAYALGIWLATSCVPDRARRFARWSGLGALAYGMMGQVAFHLLTAAHYTQAPQVVVVAVSCMPVITLGFGAALTHLLRSDIATKEQATAEATPQAAPDAIEEPAREAATEATAEIPPEAVLTPPEMPANEVHPEPPKMPVEEPASAASEEPAEKPAPRPGRLVKNSEAERGRAEYRKSVRQGQPLSQRALGAKFGKSRQWGADRIAEVEAGPALTAQVQ